MNCIPRFLILVGALLPHAALLAGPHLDATKLDLERYKALREAERYQMDLADKQFRAKQWDAAINEYRKYLKLYPGSESCSFSQFMVAYCHEGKKYVNEAIKQYQVVLDYYPDSREAPFCLFQMGQCQRKSGNFIEEKQFLMKIISEKKYAEHPIVPQVLYRLSEIASENTKDLDEVVKHRKRIVTDYPDCYYFRRCVDWLAQHYALTEDDPVSARATILRRPGMTKEEAEMWMADTYLAAARHDKDKASDYRKRARDIWETFPAKFPRATSYAKRCMLSLGQSYRDAGDHNKALEFYAKFLHQWPNDDGHRINISRYLEDPLGRWNDARMEYLKLSDKLRAQWEVAYSYHRQGGKPDEAISNYQKVLDTDFVRYAIAMFYMAEVYYSQKGDYEKAMKLFMESSYNPPQNLFRVADCLKALKRFDAAVQQYGEIVTFFKNHAAEAYLRMAHCLLNNMKKKAEAIEIYKRICRQYKGSGQSSTAHRCLEDLGIVITEGGVEK